MKNNELDIPYVGIHDETHKYTIIATNHREFEATKPQHRLSYVDLGWAIAAHLKMFESLSDDAFRDLGYHFAEQGFILFYDEIIKDYVLIKYGRFLTTKGE